jgi:hypothetical protein
MVEAVTEVETTSAREEGRFHHYVGSTIPWYVHLLWVVFWCFAAWYVIGFLLPALRNELAPPP